MKEFWTISFFFFVFAHVLLPKNLVSQTSAAGNAAHLQLRYFTTAQQCDLSRPDGYTGPCDDE